MKYLLGLIVLASCNLASAGEKNIPLSNKVKRESLINKSYVSQRDTIDNPMPKKYRKIEFLTVISLATFGLLSGTGKSIKYFKRKKK